MTKIQKTKDQNTKKTKKPKIKNLNYREGQTPTWEPE